ncbi:molybdate ABC transporter substrate-binding protein, partial [Enterococcus hirae]
PEALLADGLAVTGSRFTYAVGTLALWAPSHEATADNDTQLSEVLKSGDFRRLAIANPRVAPYGIAALEVLVALGLGDKLDKSIVRGENIAQA